MTREEFRRFLDEPGAHLILAPNLVIVGVGPEYLRLTRTRSQDLIGKYIFDVFPDNPGWKNPTGVANLCTSLTKVKETLETDKMDIQRYDIRLPDDLGGEWEERWWRPANIPIVVDGKLAYIVHRVEDATLLMHTNNLIRGQRVNNYVLYVLVMLMLGVGLFFASHENGVIQQQRRDNIYSSCVSTDQRNLKAKKLLTSQQFQVPKGTKLSPKQKAQQKQGSQFVKIYTDTILPYHKNCRAVVKTQAP